MEDQMNLIEQCLAGDRAALEQLVKNIQEQVYNLSVRFYWNPMDAEDATQEILLKVITNLASFKGQSKFETWTYRLASNYLINSKRNRTEEMTFALGEYHLRQGLQEEDYQRTDAAILAGEVKIGCTTSMLSCLSRPLRLAYILGEILAFNGVEGAYILAIEPSTFRKRLSLARKEIRAFMGKNCGLFDEANACRCTKQINYDLKIKRVEKGNLLFADKKAVKEALGELKAINDDVAIFQSHPNYGAPEALLDNLKRLFSSGEYGVLS